MTLTSSENILLSKNKLKIKLIEPTIILHGSPEDSLGCFLRGELILNLTKPTKIKKIELTFLGKIRLFFREVTDSNNNFEENDVISHTWTFLNDPLCSSDADSSSSVHSNKSLASRLFHSLSSNKSDKSSKSKYHILKKGHHSFPFELFLPGKIPESVNTSIGRITYKLSAKVLKTGVFPKLKKSQHVTILRTISDEWNQGKVISNELKDVCRYEISFLRKAFPIGDCINFELKLIPRDSNKFELQYVNIDLVERIVYSSTYMNSKPNKQESTICGIKVNDFIEEWIDKGSGNNYIFKFDKNQNNDEIRQDESSELCYHETISFRLPNSQYSIHPTYSSDQITISHDLKFLFCLKVRSSDDSHQSKLKKFTLVIPIIIIASKCKDDVLPYYESDDSSTISRTSWDEISLDDVSSPPSYESSIAGSRNNSTVNLGVYN